MQRAWCTQDNSLYSADQFDHLSSNDSLNRRQTLVCPECKGPAFFRRQSQNGREPCFGARPHTDGCSQRTAQTTAGLHHEGGANGKWLDPTSRIAVDFSVKSGVPTNRHGSVQGDSAELEDEFSAYDEHLQNERDDENSRRHMRMRPLLRTLITNPEFSRSDQVIELPGLGKFRARDFFVALPEISAPHDNLTLGVFGRIVGAEHTPQYKCVWLRTEGFNSPNIYIPQDVALSLLDHFDIRISHLAGSYILVIGTVRVSRNGQRFISVDDPRHITVLSSAGC